MANLSLRTVVLHKYGTALAWLLLAVMFAIWVLLVPGCQSDTKITPGTSEASAKSQRVTVSRETPQPAKPGPAIIGRRVTITLPKEAAK